MIGRSSFWLIFSSGARAFINSLRLREKRKQRRGLARCHADAAARPLVPAFVGKTGGRFDSSHQFVELEIVGARADVDAVNHAARRSGGSSGSRNRSLRHPCAYADASDAVADLNGVGKKKTTERRTGRYFSCDLALGTRSDGQSVRVDTHAAIVGRDGAKTKRAGGGRIRKS